MIPTKKDKKVKVVLNIACGRKALVFYFGYVPQENT